MSVGLQIGLKLLPYPAKVFLLSTFQGTVISVFALSILKSINRSTEGGLRKMLGKAIAPTVAIAVGSCAALINIGVLRLTISSINRNALLAIAISGACMGTFIAGLLMDITGPYAWATRKRI